MHATGLSDQDARIDDQRLVNYAADMLDMGKSRADVERELMQGGFDRDSASRVVTELLDSHWRSEGGGQGLLASVGVRHMGLGVLLFGAGCAVTAGTVWTSDWTGAYVVAYGAMFAGAVNFAYGVLRLIERP
jgi:hypothetical protein